jgi:ubiquitin C-terminal hydrolase
MGPDNLYEYDLFGVISHEGQIDNGHYVSYARFEDEVLFLFSFVRGLTVDSQSCSGTGLMTTSVYRSFFVLVNFLIFETESSIQI